MSKPQILKQKISQIQLEEIREVFERIDIDGGGSIDKEEMSTALKLFGVEMQDGSKKDLEDVDKSLDLDAFVNFMKNHLHDATDSVTEQFLMFASVEPDTDPEGVFINAQSLKKISDTIKEYANDQEIEDIITYNTIDEEDEQEGISRETFLKVCKKMGVLPQR